MKKNQKNLCQHMADDIRLTVKTIAWLVRRHYPHRKTRVFKRFRCKDCYWAIELDKVCGENHVTILYRPEGIRVLYLCTAIASCGEIPPKDLAKYFESLPDLKERITTLFPRIKNDISLITEFVEEVS